MHPRYLGWQVDWPVFVKVPFDANAKRWKYAQHFPWAELSMDQAKVATLYASGFLYHNEELEKQTKVGDRLNELAGVQLKSLVNLLNQEVKSRTTSKVEFDKKRCRQSTIDDKQRGLIRRFLNNNNWITEDFYRFRDEILAE